MQAKQEEQKAQAITARQRSYEYTTLDKLEMGTENVNLFAVVIDATYPHKSLKKDNWVVTFKLADPSCKFDAHGVVKFVTLVCFAKKFDDLPVIQRCGEIIRIHRGLVNTYQGNI